MKKVRMIACLAVMTFISLVGCGSKSEEGKNITIWTSGEDYKNECVY